LVKNALVQAEHKRPAFRLGQAVADTHQLARCQRAILDLLVGSLVHTPSLVQELSGKATDSARDLSRIALDRSGDGARVRMNGIHNGLKLAGKGRKVDPSSWRRRGRSGRRSRPNRRRNCPGASTPDPIKNLLLLLVFQIQRIYLLAFTESGIHLALFGALCRRRILVLLLLEAPPFF
jgi:hypothetical protein